MAKAILGMTTSLDGFVADQDGRAGRLYPDLAALQGTGFMNAVMKETGAGLVDELRIDIMPLFLGTGRRFFDNASLERVPLEKIDAREIGARTCLRFQVKR